MKENILLGKEVVIENLTPQVGKIYQKDGNRELTCIYPDVIVLDYGYKTSKDILDCSFKFKGKFRINSTSAGCGCTKPSFIKSEDEEDTYLTKVSFDPKRLGAGPITKPFTFNTSIGNISFTLYINH